ncbi:MAG TPA: DUF3373 family protein, partial [Acidobacteriota bacterium]
MRKGIMISFIILLGLLFLPQAVWSEDDSAKQEPNLTVEKLQEQILQLQKQMDLLQTQLQANQDPPAENAEPTEAEKELQERLDAVEKKSALDRLNFSGEIRVANDTLHGKLAPYFNGLQLQRGIVDSLFFMNTNPGIQLAPLPGDPNAIYQMLGSNITEHYAEYLQFVNNISFDDLKAAMSQFTPEQQMGLMQMLLPATMRPEQDYDNSILYTTRLRLNVKADIAPNLSFAGRLSMYKTWGDSSAVQIFNGQANSINLDGTTTSVPNGDAIRVDRAYFDWNHIGGSGLYLSLGRRPSSGGPPTEIRENRLRGGTPLGHVVDFQFDGVTVGYVFDSEKMPGAIYRFCYGLGYESGFGSGEQLKALA